MPTVTGDVKRIAGTTVTSGEVRFTATTPVVQDPDGNTTSLATSVAEHVVTIDGAGTFSTTLPATGDTWVYRVEISAYVDGNRVQGLPRLLLDVPDSGADLSDAGVEGSPSGRVVVNRLVGRTELTAAVAPIQQTADNALTTADNAVSRVEELEILGGVAPGDPTDATIALHMQQPTSQTKTALNAAIDYGAVEAVGGRLVFTEDPTVDVPDGTLLVHYQGPRVWTETFDDGLFGLTPKWDRRGDWSAAGGDVVLSAPNGISASRALAVDDLGEQERDVELLDEFTVGGTVAALNSGVVLRGSGRGSAKTGYLVALSGQELRVTSYLNSNVLQHFAVNVGITANTRYKRRTRLVGSQISARIWPAANPEPSTWDINFATTRITAPGWAGLTSAFATNLWNQRWHSLAIATQGGTAG